MNEVKALLEIVKSFLEEKEYSIAIDFEEEKLYDLAKKHKMSNFLIKWAKKDCRSEEIKAKIQADFNQQIMKDTNENIEFEKILNQFEEAKIKTLVVKGFIMKEVYPQNYMRQMCDIDLMAYGQDFKKASKVMKSLGYQEYYNHEKHLIFTKEPFMTVELHRKLIPGEEMGYTYFNSKIWEFCVPYRKYQHIYEMTIEDAYVFCMLHLIIHFKFTGIKMRDVLDVYLYQEKYKDVLDEDKLNHKLEEFGIQNFEENMRKIAAHWFGEEEIQELDEVEKFILRGLNGYNRVNFEVGNKGGKGKYLIRLFFPEFKVMKGKYPILEKAPILLPFTWITRILKDIFSKPYSIKGRLKTIKLVKNTDPKEVTQIHDIYEKLGMIRKED